MKSEKVAELLLKIGAVTLRPKKPFRYASGILSPIYTDNRLLMGYPKERKKIILAMKELIDEKKIDFEFVSGTATAAIPHAAWLAELLGKPMVYVRSDRKDHGKENQVEGLIKQGAVALNIEDLISTGGSAIATIDTLRNAGFVANDCVAIFTYEMKKASEAFANAGVSLHPLTTFSTLVKVAQEKGYISETELNIAKEWNKDPENWAKRFGFEG
ncbi:MAG: orotate phosphoribosyltransferase [Candidatus Diapherotrites archaeon]